MGGPWSAANLPPKETLPQCEVDLAPIRDAFLVSGMTAGDVARALGWTRVRPPGYLIADGGRVKRALGLSPMNYGRGLRGCRQRCSYESALRWVEVLGVDPVDVGL